MTDGLSGKTAPTTETSGVGGQEESSFRLDTLKQIVANYFEDMRTLGLCAAYERHLHPDVRWWSVDCEQTMEGIMHMGGEIHKHIVGPFNILPGTMTAEADRVAVEAHSDIQMDNGTQYRNHYQFLLQFEGDKIIRVHEHYDSAHANKIWEPYVASMLAKAESQRTTPITVADG